VRGIILKFVLSLFSGLGGGERASEMGRVWFGVTIYNSFTRRMRAISCLYLNRSVVSAYNKSLHSYVFVYFVALILVFLCDRS